MGTLGLLLFLLVAAVCALALPAVLYAHTRGGRQLTRVSAGFASVCLLVTTFTPVLFVGLLHMVSLRARQVTGALPVSLYGPAIADPLYRGLIDAAGSAFGALFLWTPGWLCLMVLLRNTHPRWARGLLAVLFSAGWLLLCLDPGGRVAWWLG